MSEASSKTLGERIRELREERDLSLRELGKKLSLSAAFLSDVELGHRHPSDKILKSLARALDTSFDDLKAYDMRPTVQDLKRLVTQNPAYGFALRKVMDKGVSPKDLIEFIDKRERRKKS
jgi:transcriptional regulator with XRE-family HTH domain